LISLAWDQGLLSTTLILAASPLAFCSNCQHITGFPGPICQCQLWQRGLTVAEASLRTCPLWTPRSSGRLAADEKPEG